MKRIPAGVLVVLSLVLLVPGTSCKRESTSVEGPWDSTGNTIDSISFIVVGDWGRDGAYSQRSVAEAIHEYSKKFHAAFIISTGDNFYPDGVNSVGDPQWASSFENIYNKEGHQIAWYPVLGNHDYMSNPSAQLLYSRISRRWQMPARYYSFEKSISSSDSALFVFADTPPFITSYYRGGLSDLAQQDTVAQRKWLQQTLGASNARWKIVVGHHPVYSVGQHGNSPDLIRRFKPLFRETGTDFYICGHDHNLQYLSLPGDPVHYLVSGGGSEHTPVDPNSFSLFARGTPGFLLMTLYAQRANFYFYNQRGELLYRRQVLQ